MAIGTQGGRGAWLRAGVVASLLLSLARLAGAAEECGTPVGVSIDVDGFVWMVDYNGWAYRIDPNTYEKVLVPIAGDHYTYSDMTGGGLVNAVVTPG